MTNWRDGMTAITIPIRFQFEAPCFHWFESDHNRVAFLFRAGTFDKF